MPAVVPLYYPGQSITGQASSASDLVGGRFVMVAATKADGEPLSVTYSSARGAAVGVIVDDAARGEVAAILTPGAVVPVEASGSITAGDNVSSAASGRAARFDTSGEVLGIALTTASASEFVLVQLR